MCVRMRMCVHAIHVHAHALAHVHHLRLRIDEAWLKSRKQALATITGVLKKKSSEAPSNTHS